MHKLVKNKVKWINIHGATVKLTKMFRFPYSVLYPRVKVKVSPQHAVQAHKGPKGMAPLILNLGTRWRWLFNTTLRRLVPWERARVPIWQDARSGSPSLSQSVKKRKSLSSQLVFDPQLSSSYRNVTLTALSQLLSPKLVQIINVNYVFSYFS